MEDFFGIAEQALLFVLKLLGSGKGSRAFYYLPFFIGMTAICMAGVSSYLLLRSSMPKKVKWYGQAGIMAAIIALAAFLNECLPSFDFIETLPLALCCSAFSRWLAINVEWSESTHIKLIKKCFSAFIILAPVLHYAHVQYVDLTYRPSCPVLRGMSISGPPPRKNFWENLFGIPLRWDRECVPPEVYKEKYDYYFFGGFRIDLNATEN